MYILSSAVCLYKNCTLFTKKFKFIPLTEFVFRLFMQPLEFTFKFALKSLSVAVHSG